MKYKDKSLKYCFEKNGLFISIDVQKSPILISLWHSIDKAASAKLVHPIDNSVQKLNLVLMMLSLVLGVDLFSKWPTFSMKTLNIPWMIET